MSEEVKMHCPMCGNREEFRIWAQVPIDTQWDPDGGFLSGNFVRNCDYDWVDNTPCRCLKCEHEKTVGFFEKEDQ